MITKKKLLIAGVGMVSLVLAGGRYRRGNWRDAAVLG